MTDLPILSPIDLSLATEELYDSGLARGDNIGFTGLRPFYSVGRAQWTCVTGYPGSGKSEFVDQIMVNLAMTEGWEFAIYSPENYPHALHVSKLIEKYVGKPFGTGVTERLSKDELKKATHWVLKHFRFLAPDQKDYRSLLDAAVKFRSLKFGVVLDPWNALESLRPPVMSETDYIGRALTDVVKWVRDYDLHMWIVAHPAKMLKFNGERPVPTPYDIAGSAHWYNKADNIICVHRPDMDNDIVDIHVQKVRFKYLGRVGGAQLRYNRVTGRYLDLPPGHMQAIPAPSKKPDDDELPF